MAFKKGKFFGEKFPIDFSYSGYIVVDLVRVDGEIIPHRNFFVGGFFFVWDICSIFVRIMKAKQYKIRFNLGRGKNYMKWKIDSPDGTTQYYDPQAVQLVMYECTLKNNRKVAEKIHPSGGNENKSVCAYILCERIEILAEKILEESNISVRYNPKVLPYWTVGGSPSGDTEKYGMIFSVGDKLFLPPKKQYLGIAKVKGPFKNLPPTIVPIWVEDPNE